jgi:hypothetical protein
LPGEHYTVVIVVMDAQLFDAGIDDQVTALPLGVAQYGIGRPCPLTVAVIIDSHTDPSPLLSLLFVCGSSTASSLGTQITESAHKHKFHREMVGIATARGLR